MPDEELLDTITTGFRHYACSTIRSVTKQARPSPTCPWSEHDVTGQGGSQFKDSERLYTQFTMPHIPGSLGEEWISFQFRTTPTEKGDKKVLRFRCHLCCTSNTTSSDHRGGTSNLGDDSNTHEWKWDNAYGSNIINHVKSLQHHAALVAYHKGALHNFRFLANSLGRVPTAPTGTDPLANVGGDLPAKYKTLKAYINWREELIKMAEHGKAWNMDDIRTDPTTTPTTMATLSRCDASNAASQQ